MWPFRRGKRKGSKESQQAVLDAVASLRTVKDRDSEVHAVSRTLREIRENNHFAEKLRIIMERG